MMTPRLLELHRVLKPTGSLYLHCDPAASHYLKLVLDAVFGPTNFRNEIVWRRTGTHGKARRYAPIHDTLLFYSKTDAYTWNFPKKPYMRRHVEEYFVQDERGWRTNYYGNVLTGSGLRKGESGKPWRGFDPSAKGRHWAIPGAILEELDEDLSGLTQHQKLDRLLEMGYIKITPGQAWPLYERYLRPEGGQAVSDIWAFQPYTEGTVFGTDKGIDEDVRWLSPQDQERLGYQTQKPLGVLRRIIQASSNPGDLVLDPFCGCGTAVVAAEELGRSWIGIDITYLAVDVMARRLRDHFPNIQFEVRGQPRDVEGARALAQKDRFQFQFWALSLIGAQAVMPGQRGPDRGVDGYLPFLKGAETDRAVVSVKSGGVGVRDVRDLVGTMQREKADCGLLITLEGPTRDMHREAVEAGEYQMPGIGGRLPRVEILTVEDLLVRGRRPTLAPYSPGPVAQAPRLRRRAGQQPPLPSGPPKGP
jgi:site-specific DNA-methyltransferase (adenine-specific)